MPNIILFSTSVRSLLISTFSHYVYNELSKACCVSSQQANSIIPCAPCRNASRPSSPWRPVPHAMAQLALWLIHLCALHKSTFCTTVHSTDYKLQIACVAYFEGGSVAEWLACWTHAGAEGPGFRSQPRRCRLTILGKLFTPIVPLFIEQRNW